MENVNIGKRIKELRQSKNLKLSEFAKAMNISIACASRWENGNREPDLTTVAKLAKFFECTSDFLLGIEN